MDHVIEVARFERENNQLFSISGGRVVMEADAALLDVHIFTCAHALVRLAVSWTKIVGP